MTDRQAAPLERPLTPTLEHEELLEVQWFDRTAISDLDRHDWIDRVLRDSDLSNPC